MRETGVYLYTHLLRSDADVVAGITVVMPCTDVGTAPILVFRLTTGYTGVLQPSLPIFVIFSA